MGKSRVKSKHKCYVFEIAPNLVCISFFLSIRFFSPKLILLSKISLVILSFTLKYSALLSDVYKIESKFLNLFIQYEGKDGREIQSQKRWEWLNF